LPILAQPTLWILGHGRIAECLCQIGALMGLDVIIDDPLAGAERFPDASCLIADDSNYDAIKPEASDFIVVATQHNGDHQSMRRILASDACYIALIASHKRTDLVLNYLRHDGFNDGILNRVHAPAGLDLGAQTPEEVAISVISEIVLLRRRGRGFTVSRVDEAKSLVQMDDAVVGEDRHETETMSVTSTATSIAKTNGHGDKYSSI
jgi:xanthine dehydrogenase accessory factor